MAARLENHNGEERAPGIDRDEGSPGSNSDQIVRDPYFATLPIIEISDKDYRSFSLPCDALEDTGDDKPVR